MAQSAAAGHLNIIGRKRWATSGATGGQRGGPHVPWSRRSRRRCRAARSPSRSTPATPTCRSAGTTRCACNYGVRVEGRDDKIGNSARRPTKAPTASTRGDAVAKRLDLLSELDVVYKKRYGAPRERRRLVRRRLRRHEPQQPEPAAGQHPELRRQPVQQLHQALLPRRRRASCWTPSSSAASTSATCRCRPRLGRHTRVLGRVAVPRRQPARHRLRAEPARPAEGLRHARHRGQGAVPAAEPAVGAGAGDRHACRSRRSTCSSGSPFRYPEGGTYLGPVDFVFNGPDRQFLSPALGLRRARRRRRAAARRGEWGLSARWSPAWLDGTLGFYYRRFADKLPQTLLTQVGAERQPLQPDLRRRHRPVRHQPGEEHRRRQRRRRALVPPQHAAQQPGARRRARPAGRRATPRARAATPGTRWSTCVGTIPKTPVFDSRHLGWPS